MTTAEALIAATTAFGGLTVSVVGWMITRQVGRVDAKVDLLVSKDSAQDLLIAAAQARIGPLEAEDARLQRKLDALMAHGTVIEVGIAECQSRLKVCEDEINRTRERLHRLIDLTAGSWTPKVPAADVQG